MENKPLVSVMVIAYNAETTILELLNSVKGQTYSNIELIISDDHSTDNTIEICKDWIERNKSRFFRAVIIGSEKNTGTAANLNRAISEVEGKWIKGIAGDDKLTRTCIEDNINYVEERKDVRVLFSLCQGFNQDGLIGDGNQLDEESRTFYQLSSKEQFEYLIKHPSPTNLAATAFIDSEIIKKFPYDERIPFQEDYPKWIDFTKNGIKLYLMDKITVFYRYSESLSNSFVSFYNPRFMESQMLHFYLDRKKLLEERGYIDIIKDEELKFLTYLFSKIVLRNKRNILTRFLRRMFFLTINAIKE